MALGEPAHNHAIRLDSGRDFSILLVSCGCARMPHAAPLPPARGAGKKTAAATATKYLHLYQRAILWKRTRLFL